MSYFIRLVKKILFREVRPKNELIPTVSHTNLINRPVNEVIQFPISRQSLSLEFKISLRTALRNLTCIPTVSEIARLRSHCNYAKCADSTFGSMTPQNYCCLSQVLISSIYWNLLNSRNFLS